jgi:ribonuclease HI
MFKITKNWLYQNSNGGACSKNQLQILKLSYPLKSGWRDRLVGKEITFDEKQQFENLRKVIPTKNIIKPKSSTKMVLDVYTDGSWWQNRQGASAVFLVKGEWFYITHYADYGTNNRAEMMGAIIALEFLKSHPNLKFDVVTIYSDSQYVVNTINKGWKKRKNIDLWQRLEPLVDHNLVNFVWVRGHDGNKGNEIADKLANETQETRIATTKLTRVIL